VDNLSIESAKSSLAYEAANRESNVGAAAAASFVNQALLGLPRDYDRRILQQAEVIIFTPFFIYSFVALGTDVWWTSVCLQFSR
jgi:hypothetical protein